MQEEIKWHRCHVQQDQDILESQDENQVSLCEEGYGAQSRRALPAWQHELSPRAKSILTPAAQVLPNIIPELRGLPRQFQEERKLEEKLTFLRVLNAVCGGVENSGSKERFFHSQWRKRAFNSPKSSHSN